jgi:hypothetical protein
MAHSLTNKEFMMMISGVISLILCILLFIDPILYFKVVERHGPQNKTWPGSGYWLMWKYRKYNQG